MEHISKVKQQFLINELNVSDGGISKLEYDWLMQMTDKDKSTPDLWYELFKQNGVTNLRDYLRLFGYTGDINKSLYNYYDDRPAMVLSLTSDLEIRGI